MVFIFRMSNKGETRLFDLLKSVEEEKVLVNDSLFSKESCVFCGFRFNEGNEGPRE